MADQTFHPDSPLMDGAMPRSNSERVDLLLAYAEARLARLAPAADSPLAVRAAGLREEWREYSAQETPRPPLVHPDDEFEFWHEVEDDVMALISDLLPDPWYCTLHPDDPGTVVIWNSEDDDDA